MMNIGLNNIAEYEAELKEYALTKLTSLNWLKLQGQPDNRGAIFSFTMEFDNMDFYSALKYLASLAGLTCSIILSKSGLRFSLGPSTS